MARTTNTSFMISGPLAFERRLQGYRTARGTLDAAANDQGDQAREQLVERIDTALDLLLLTGSPDAASFQTKLEALEREYGYDWQPRHVGALLADARSWSPSHDRSFRPRPSFQ